KKHEPEVLDPEIAGRLREEGLLHLLEAESIVDKEATAQLADAMGKVIASGSLDRLAKEKTAFHHLSYSRLGGYGDAELADEIHGQRQGGGFAGAGEKGFGIQMHPRVRVFVLVLPAQILRAQGRRRNMELAPATDRPELVEALGELITVPTPVWSGSIV